jgi:hypothetical protein
VRRVASHTCASSTDLHANCDGYTKTDTDEQTNFYTNADLDTNAHGSVDTHANGDGYMDTDTDAHTNFYTNTDLDTNAHA